jgi:hypothetical protein
MQENNSRQGRASPWFLERATDLEYRFLKGRRHRGADLVAKSAKLGTRSCMC